MAKCTLRAAASLYNSLTNYQKDLVLQQTGLHDFTPGQAPNWKQFSSGEKKVICETLDDLGY